MKEDLEKQLFHKHAVLFKDSNVALEVGDGWYTLLDKLCEVLTFKFNCALKELENCKEDKMLDTYRAILDDEAERLPKVLQIKEKFGALRFYVIGASAEALIQIDFAEHLSSSVCEICGAIGQIAVNSGWMQSMCERCRNGLKDVKVSKVAET